MQDDALSITSLCSYLRYSNSVDLDTRGIKINIHNINVQIIIKRNFNKQKQTKTIQLVRLKLQKAHGVRLKIYDSK